MPPSSSPLPWRVRLLYGSGDYGTVLAFQLAGLFLLFFLTEVLAIPPALAGALVLAGLVFDGATDIVMGVVADRWRARLGGYRPWLALGAPALALATVLLFWAPDGSVAVLAVFALLAQLVFRLAFTIVAIPYMALSSALTDDSRERAVLVGIRLTFATLATLTIAVAVLPLVDLFGGGDRRAGFTATAAVIGTISALVVLNAWWATRGRERPARAAEAMPPVRALPGLVAANGPFRIVAVAILLQSIAQAFVLTGAPYFFTHARGEPETLGVSLAVLIGGVALFMPVWTALQARLSKRATWLFGALWSSASLAMLAAASQAPLPLFMLAMGFAAFGFAALGLAGFAMLPDTVEFGAWRTGARVEAGLVSALTFTQKCASGIASFGVGLLLAAAGHEAGAPMAGGAAVTFGVLLFAIPALVIALSLPVVWRYRLSARAHRALLRALARRAARGG